MIWSEIDLNGKDFDKENGGKSGTRRQRELQYFINLEHNLKVENGVLGLTSTSTELRE